MEIDYNPFDCSSITQLNYLNSRKLKLSLATSCSIFLIFFFIFFQPFGVNNYKHELSITLKWILEISTFGFPIFISIAISEFFFKSIFIKKYSLIKTILWYAVEFVFIGSVSFFHYNLLGSFHDLKWSSYGLHIINISAVIILPFIATLFIFNYRILKEKNRELLDISRSILDIKQLFLFTGKYKKDEIALRLDQILFFEAQDNYVAIYHLEDNKLKKHLLRSTLFHVESIITSKVIIRCHRSFIVNLSNVESFKKKKNKLQLKVKNFKDCIFVSKKYEEGVIKLLDQLLIVSN